MTLINLPRASRVGGVRGGEGEVGRGAPLRCPRVARGVLRATACSRDAGKQGGMCQGGQRKPIQAGRGGVICHSGRDFPRKGKAAHLVVDDAEVVPRPLLSRPRPLHVVLALLSIA